MARTSLVLGAIGALTVCGVMAVGYRLLERALWPPERVAAITPVSFPPDRLVADLDEAVQIRFAYFDLIRGVFGTSRVLQDRQVAGHGTLMPAPQIVAEGPMRGTWVRRRDPVRPARWDSVRVADDYDPVKALDHAGWESAVAIATRVPSKKQGLVSRFLGGRKGVRLSRDPLILTSETGSTPPSHEEKERAGIEALAGGETESEKPTRVGMWSVTARPIVAGTRECVRCHSSAMDGKPLRVGDTLAVALYAFKARDARPIAPMSQASR